jgi:hypothetical protein
LLRFFLVRLRIDHLVFMLLAKIREAARRQLKGFGTIISFDVRGDAPAASDACAGLRSAIPGAEVSDVISPPITFRGGVSRGIVLDVAVVIGIDYGLAARNHSFDARATQ